MSSSCHVAMSERISTSEHQDASLLGHDNDLASQRWEQEQEAAARVYKHMRGICVRAFLLTLVLLLFISFAFFLRRHSAASTFEAPVTQPTESTDLVEAISPAHDLKILLHPEDHVSRDPSIRYFLWNITKATIAPNGVRRDVFLIDSTPNTYSVPFPIHLTIAADEFPGPTIEARSGDTLEIEVFNFAEEGISLHWHGLHMKGTYNSTYLMIGCLT
jgi:hypothetical protein